MLIESNEDQKKQKVSGQVERLVMPSASVQGRSEALQIILNLDPEGGMEDYIGSYASGDSGDYDSEWDVKKLKALLHVGDEYENSPGCKMSYAADALYWENVAKGDDMDTLKGLVSRLLGEIEDGKVQDGVHCTVNILKTWVA